MEKSLDLYFYGRIISNDNHNTILSSDRIYLYSHDMEPYKEQKMAGRSSLYNHSHAFSP